MDQVSKFFRKLSRKERERVFAILEQIQSRDIRGLNIKKLSGHEYMYRVRIGRVRIMYFDDGNSIAFLKAGFRDDNTYRDF